MLDNADDYFYNNNSNNNNNNNNDNNNNSGAPWVTKFIHPRKSGYDVAYACPPTRVHTSCKPMSNVTIDLPQLD